ncbi:DAUER UP-REGULATED-RELATED [Salix purpurea]|uniref:DAUER UP-REGULATED-RELATED n=1 Tax=Salix purpurea TaxID=77065 RepID=A0A9Q0WGX8_SALPP|nr:DAUER UP-REGULATED-RELATED [Salix purpurea]
MLNLAKAFFPKSPSLLPNSSPKVSRGRHAAVDNRDHPASDYAERAKETANETFDRTRERVEKARERSRDMKDKAKGHARETWHGLRLRRLKKEKAKEGTGRAAGTAHDVKEKAKDDAGAAGDMEKEVAIKVVETVEIVGEKAKQTVKGAWECREGNYHRGE